MKKLALILIVCLWHASGFALPIAIGTKANPDSVMYEKQRNKINAMLDARHRKFGQYDESLKKHTGIFGLQTKKDIRRSNDILMDIARTDDSIFIQTKILLNYRTQQQQQAEQKSTINEDHSVAYMGTINRLRDQIDKLKQENLDLQRHQQSSTRWHYIIFVLMLGSILILLFRRRHVAT
jgi:hypothetical protein